MKKFTFVTNVHITNYLYFHRLLIPNIFAIYTVLVKKNVRFTYLTYFAYLAIAAKGTD